MSEDTLPGWVTRMQSGFVTVRTGLAGEVVCRLRGRLKKHRFEGDILAIGDRVQVMLLPDGTGMIEEIEPRVRALVRMAPTPRGEYIQILLANLDQVVLVFACAQPEPRLRMLDRFLVICEKQGIPPLIVANKVDLVGVEAAEAIYGKYPGLGYPVIYTSVKTGEGVEALHQHLSGKISGLAGPSGVGKSSLLNAIQPDLGLAVRPVSEANAKGKHTTVVRELFPLIEGGAPQAGPEGPLNAGGASQAKPIGPLNAGGYVADLPGLKSLALWDTQPEELDGYFPELRDLVAYCQFSDCTHRVEPGCAVRKAVAEGRVHPERYESYLRMRFGGKEE
jgi:ribosome biogenesis GTPase / thiamine phosphate phosphatase